MLVLSRRLNEKIVIPAVNITIQVIAVRPGVVRLGFDGPAEIKVFRQEVLDANVLVELPPDSIEILQPDSALSVPQASS